MINPSSKLKPTLEDEITTYVRVSQPPSFSPRLTGSRIPTAPLLPIPNQNNPNVDVRGLPDLPFIVRSLAKTHNAFPP